MVYSGPGFVRLDGRVLLRSTKISLKIDSNNSDVVTILGGREGHTPGPTAVTASVESPIPADGFEVDFPRLCAAGAEHTLDFVIGSTEYPCVGDIRSSGVEGAAGSPNSTSFDFSGRLVLAA
jgi:hypothetical protein